MGFEGHRDVMEVTRDNCRTDNIAAYLDGELGLAESSEFESHLRDCSSCTSELQEQKMFLCELEFALADEPAPPLPANFVEVVSVNAQSDMHGVRSLHEGGRALKVLILLSLASLFAVGGAVGDLPGTVLRPVFGVAGMVLHLFYGFAAGATIVSRSVGEHFLLESPFLSVLALLLLIASASLLPRLISRYHRANN